jgi:hypothetical protein
LDFQGGPLNKVLIAFLSSVKHRKQYAKTDGKIETKSQFSRNKQNIILRYFEQFFRDNKNEKIWISREALYCHSKFCQSAMVWKCIEKKCL